MKKTYVIDTNTIQETIKYFKQERNKHTAPFRPYYDLAIEALEAAAGNRLAGERWGN